MEWTFRIDETGALSPVLGWDLRSRQQLPAAYQLNGAVYAARTDHLRSGGRLVERGTGAVVMPSERSIDVDTELDLEIARHLATRQSD